MATTSPRSKPPELRLLLDQGFPKPPGFNLAFVDRTVEAVHLSDFDRELSTHSTPDWMIYWRAAHAGFHALVARDRAQLDQTLEMYVLSQLPNFAVITWRKHVEDPIREWGQLLAYLPEIKRVLRHRGARAILLPAPTLQPGNLINPTDTIGTDATQRGISHGQAKREVRAELQRWLDEHGHDRSEFAPLLRARRH